MKDILQACDNTLAKCQQANRDKDVVIKTQKEELDTALKDEQAIRNEQSSILNNKLLWFALGALFTGGIYKLTH